MDLEIVSTVVFFTLVAIFLWRDRKKIEFNYGIVVRRMYSGRKALDLIVKRHRRTFKVLGNIGVFVAVITAVIGTSLLVIYPLISKEKAFGLVLPTVSAFRYPGPIISVPVWYWLIAVFIIMACHETMHAIMSRLAGISIKNYGLIFLLVLPIGAFVDPDMKKVAKLKLMPKLRIYAAGSFGNFIVGFLMIVLFLSTRWVAAQSLESTGVNFEGVVEGSPAHDVGLSGTIYQIDDVSIKSRFDLFDFLATTEPGKTVKILTTEGEFQLTTEESPYAENVSYFGLKDELTEVYKYSAGPYAGEYAPDILMNSLFAWLSLLMWISVLSLGVAIVNLLPMKPLDGGYIFEELAKERFGKSAKRLTKIATISTALLLIFNLVFLDLIKFLFSLMQ